MATDDDPEVPIVCDACDTRTRVALPEAADAIDRHNSQLHDGDERAQVDPAVADQLLDMVAEDLELIDDR
jgi:hypothetical protein